MTLHACAGTPAFHSGGPPPAATTSSYFAPIILELCRSNTYSATSEGKYSMDEECDATFSASLA